ncbi:hypothetical protein AVEN_186536-1 [Araneus ventricosus]|uniref:Uncharacterized protein n=1 Tax=Araneus ventricosus TaxID=182803 RepID=A0A4Y2J8K8_ARAVE|nr:hypothetical protein AVEN_186536-1 [Araneus ventricosus]
MDIESGNAFRRKPSRCQWFKITGVKQHPVMEESRSLKIMKPMCPGCNSLHKEGKVRLNTLFIIQAIYLISSYYNPTVVSPASFHGVKQHPVLEESRSQKLGRQPLDDALEVLC